MTCQTQDHDQITGLGKYRIWSFSKFVSKRYKGKGPARAIALESDSRPEAL